MPGVRSNEEFTNSVPYLSASPPVFQRDRGCPRRAGGGIWVSRGEGAKRYAVMGAGAVGSFVGGMLPRAGLPVVLIGRPAHVEAIRRDGLEVGGLVGPFYVRLNSIDSPDGVKDADVVLLCVKSQDTPAACAALAPWIPERAPVVSLQNGVRNLDLIDESPLGPGRGVAGTAVFNAVFLEPGRVLLKTSGELIVDAAQPAERRNRRPPGALAEPLESKSPPRGGPTGLPCVIRSGACTPSRSPSSGGRD